MGFMHRCPVLGFVGGLGGVLENELESSRRRIFGGCARDSPSGQLAGYTRFTERGEEERSSSVERGRGLGYTMPDDAR